MIREQESCGRRTVKLIRPFGGGVMCGELHQRTNTHAAKETLASSADPDRSVPHKFKRKFIYMQNIFWLIKCNNYLAS